MKSIAIFGSGGFGRDVLSMLGDVQLGNLVQAFYESDDVWSDRHVSGLPVLPLSRFNPQTTEMILAIANPTARRLIRDLLPPETQYPTIIHPNVVRSSSVTIGQGSVVCAGSILTHDIIIGEQVHLNVMTTIGHDCILGDFVTTAPAVNISGNCHIGNGCYFGTNACLREKLTLAAKTTIGMGGVVVSSIHEAGVYIGIPAKRMHK
jgi:sugar O-acyltransferase (sialic acid O-acetyltransferase NeuD family)